MRDQEILGLQEAYLQVHQPQELTEEVQIAAQYFYEMGLNEEGVEILIEELGVEEFAEWVQDLSDEHYLEEARRSGAIEPKTAKGQEIKGKPSAASLKRLRRLKAERGESEERASEQKPSGLTASLRRQSAVANAKKQQPKKKGVLDRVAGAVLSGIERHNKAMGELEKMKAATAETAGKVKKAAGEFARGFRGEEFDLFDTILEHLVAEGYADTNQNALVIMANMSEEWRESIVETIWYGRTGFNPPVVQQRRLGPEVGATGGFSVLAKKGGVEGRKILTPPGQGKDKWEPGNWTPEARKRFENQKNKPPNLLDKIVNTVYKDK